MRRVILLLLPVLVAACVGGSSRDEPSQPAVSVPPPHPGLLVVPAPSLTALPDAYSMVEESGPISAQRYAEDSLDPTDTAIDIVAAGFKRGYELLFGPAEHTADSQLLMLGTGAYEWTDSAAAQEALVKVATDIQESPGSAPEGISRVRVSPFSLAPTGESAVGYRMEFEVDGAGTIYQTLAYARTDAFLAGAVLTTFDDTDTSATVSEMLSQVVARQHARTDVEAIRDYLVAVSEEGLEFSEAATDLVDGFAPDLLEFEPELAARVFDRHWERYQEAAAEYLVAVEGLTPPVEAQRLHDLHRQQLGLAAGFDLNAPPDELLVSVTELMATTGPTIEEQGRLTAVVLADRADDPVATYIADVWALRRELGRAFDGLNGALTALVQAPSDASANELLDELDDFVDKLEGVADSWDRLVPPRELAALHERTVSLHRALADAERQLVSGLKTADIESLGAAEAALTELYAPGFDIGMEWSRIELGVLRDGTVPQALIAPAGDLQPGPFDETRDAAADIAAALELAATDGRRVMLDFGANWCPDCVALDELLHSPEVQPTLDAGYHLVRIDVGYFDRNLAIAERYLPRLEVISTVVILESDGTLLTVAEEFGFARHMITDDVIEVLQHWAPPQSGAS